MACLVLSLTASLVMGSLYEMPWSFLKHLISVGCNFFKMSFVNVQVSQAYNRTEVTRERISLIFKLREICLSYRLSLVSLVLLLSVQFWTVLQAWNLDLWLLCPDTWSCQRRSTFHRWFWCQCWFHLCCWSSVWSSLHYFSCQRPQRSYPGDPPGRLVPPLFLPSHRGHP